jgi:hypothetical protein
MNDEPEDELEDEAELAAAPATLRPTYFNCWVPPP